MIVFYTIFSLLGDSRAYFGEFDFYVVAVEFTNCFDSGSYLSIDMKDKTSLDKR